jgi:hypothetical protein
VKFTSRTQAILLGGTFSGVLSSLPYVSAGNCCCAWPISGGVVAVCLLRQSQAELFSLDTGAIAGALSGLVGACVYLLVSLPIQYVLVPLQPTPADIFPPSSEVPPEVVALAVGVISSPFLLVLLGFTVMLLVGTVFSALGGLFGTLFLRSQMPSSSTSKDDLVPPPPGLET